MAPPGTQLLVRANHVTVQLFNDHVQLTAGPHGLKGPASLLDVLMAFSQPQTAAAVLASLPQAQTRPGWMMASTHIVQLTRAGILRPHDGQPGRPLAARGYAGADVHVRMLDDAARTDAFLAAIAETVRPGDIVVDLGTGTGVLAVAAAKAGARHVYAIEASAMADHAEAVFAANGLADRITMVRGWSTEITLPERGTVLVSEMIGGDPVGEQLPVIVTDARERLLQPHARLIPQRLRTFALPCQLPDATTPAIRFAPDALIRWRDRYGIDFSALGAALPPACTVTRLSASAAASHVPLDDPKELADLDLRAPLTGVIDISWRATMASTGRLDGALLYFEAPLSPSVTLSTDPRTAASTNHWGNLALRLGRPHQVERGDRLDMRVERRTGRYHLTTQDDSPEQGG